MVEVAHRQITLFKSVPPSGSLFFFRREAINFHSSSMSDRFPRFRKRPSRDGSFYLDGAGVRKRRRVAEVESLASLGNGHLETRRKSGHSAEHVVEGTFRGTFHHIQTAFRGCERWKTNSLPWNFHEQLPAVTLGRIIAQSDLKYAANELKGLTVETSSS